MELLQVKKVMMIRQQLSVVTEVQTPTGSEANFIK